MATSYYVSASSVYSAASPTVSVWSRGHSAKSSASSTSFTSSPTQTRDSLDLFGAQKRLEDVREEEDISSRKMCSFDDYRCGDSSNFLDAQPFVSPCPNHSWTDQDANSTTSLGHQHHSKRQRSLDGPRRSVTQGFSTRFGSLSRRWKNRSAITPSLSIDTHMTPIASPRSSMDTPNYYYSRSGSVASNAQGIYSPASMHSFTEEPILESEVVPLYIDHSEPQQDQEDQGQATTPLLPPTMLNLKKQDSPIQSPLQSPSIAPTNYCHTSPMSYDHHSFAYLPSPPLSNQPSLASMPRTRSNTATYDIPTLQQLSERLDPWTIKLGHADFSIHPEPYRPDSIHIDSYKEFRENWAQARKHYTQHLARTIENYGETSKIYKLTEEKWNSIDQEWKKYDAHMNAILAPEIQRLSDGPATAESPTSSLLERPVTRVTVPHMDKGGKFPEIGDADIVGPLSIGVAKVPELQRGTLTPPLSPKKRSLIKTIGDIFKN